MMLLITLLLEIGVFFPDLPFCAFFGPSHMLEAAEVMPEKLTQARMKATSNNFNVHCVMTLLNMSPALL